ncbi:cytidylate kinase-like family protein [Butyrivibrio sp. NC3005]|uniref:cytidylate kinase-like family protein n=1 Tax=Butyrivibrio sp. NC3005 TaxID=1280685 RepID=UPI00041DF913|nr:cytidylate kinase-like family protein [Butyrivibrio sp. NC3005]
MNSIITIGREFGSGGRAIGELVAKKCNVKYYDKELIARVAKESGFCEEMIENHDERPTNSFLYNLVMDTYSFGYNSSSFMDMPISHKVFLAQFDTIKKIAKEGPCVIIGRCADYALSDFSNVVNIFITADEKEKIRRIKNRYADITSDEKARDMFLKKDKQRKSYYNYYTSKKWAACDSYDLTVRAGIVSDEATADFIIDYVNKIEETRKNY